jgi:threonine dehydrogenase-like Zn-dependent dehydrogenase
MSEWKCFGVAWVLLLRVVSVGICGNKWNGMKGMMGNVFVVMLEVSGDVVRVRRVVLWRNCEYQMMRG